MPDVYRQLPDGTWEPAEPVPAPWLVRMRNGQMNGTGQRVIAAVVVGVLLVVHLVADVVQHRHRQPPGRHHR